MRLNTIKLEETHCFWNNIFTSEEISQIIEYCENVPRTYGVVGNDDDDESLDTEVRKSEIAWIYRNEETEWFFSRIQATNNKLNSRFFGFDLDVLDTIQYTIYNDSGDHYDWHWDCFVGNNLDSFLDERQRKFTSVIQLSDVDEYDEGCLEILPCGTLKRFKLEKGTMISFPSFVLHRVTPVTSGIRRTLVAWFTGPDWR